MFIFKDFFFFFSCDCCDGFLLNCAEEEEWHSLLLKPVMLIVACIVNHLLGSSVEVNRVIFDSRELVLLSQPY